MNSIIKINPRTASRKIGDDMVIINCENHKIATLNETGSLLWSRILNGSDFNNLVNALSSEFLVDRETSKKDVALFLGEMSILGFLNYETGVAITQQALGQEVSGENVLLDLEMNAIRNLIPFASTFEVTYACNENCRHCYMEKKLDGLATSDIVNILDQLANAGTLFLTFTGGEFFCKKDSKMLLEKACQMGFAVDVLSNGTLIDKEVVSIASKGSVRRIQVSIYGATAETHDNITRIKGSFHRSVAGIELLRSRGVKVEIAFTLMRSNFNERHGVQKLAKSLDCLLSPSHVVTVRNNGATDTLKLRLTNRQLNLFLRERELSGAYSGRKSFRDHQFYLGIPDLLEAAPCYSGFNSFAISPNGIVLPCNQLLLEAGNLKQAQFLEIWQHSEIFKRLRKTKLKDLPQCSACALLLDCARCPGLALLEGGDLLGPSPINCLLAKAEQTKNERR